MKSKNAIVCSFDNSADYVEHTIGSIENYAKKINANLFVFKGDDKPVTIFTDDKPQWRKWGFLFDVAIKESPNKLLLLDADIYINKNAPDIFSKKRGFACTEYKSAKEYKEWCRKNFVKHLKWVNTGVVMINLSDVHQLIEIVTKREEPPRGEFFVDQGFMSSCLSQIEGFNCGGVSDLWNWRVPHTHTYVPHAWFYHVAGSSFGEWGKLEYLKKIKECIELNKPWN